MTPTPTTDATAAAATGNYVRDMLTMSGVARRFEGRTVEAETELGETMLVLGKALYPDADLVAGDVLELAKAVVAKLADPWIPGAREAALNAGRA